MRMVDLIEKKRDNLSLTKEEIDFIINKYTEGSIPDYQMSALAMAIFFNGMDAAESTHLSLAMLYSGDQMDLSGVEGIKVDKHSTGGVGDKTTLVLAPLVASVGVKFAKMSGRGLGHTGGTLDKLEAIEGFDINMSTERFIKQMNDIGVAVVGQTGNLTPADKKLYALRDVTGTVPSIPLIASSIMSKKLASGSDVICLDVKVGSGAFMKTIEEATELAELMVSIGSNVGKKMTAILTDMDEPLGLGIGNSLEVIEAINTLKGQGPKDLETLCLDIGSHLVFDAKKATSLEEARSLLETQIKNGNAFETFVALVKAQGGNTEVIRDTEKFTKAKEIIEVKAQSSGVVTHINALELGISAMLLGAGRETKDDAIDYAVGIVLNKKSGDKVSLGDTLCYVHTNGKNTKEVCDRVLKAMTIGNKATLKPLILKTIK